MLHKHLANLVLINQKQGVKIGEVLVIADSYTLQKLKSPGDDPQQIQKFQQELQTRQFDSRDEVSEFVMLHGTYSKYPALVGLTYNELQDAKKILDFYKIQSSPTWIVRHLGRDYVFEGFSSPFSLFNNKGEFIRADY